MNKLPNISEIKNELESNGKMLIDNDDIVFDAYYFNDLVLQLPKFQVSEIRPLYRISITKGIDSKIIYPYLDELQNQIKEYKKLRKKIFNQFLDNLNLKNIEGEFYKLRNKLKETNDWPKGNFGDWNYWFHGGDIEFDNNGTGQHFNIRMTNIRSIKFWSIYKFIIGTNRKSDVGKFIFDKKEVIIKMFDLLVIEKRMIVIRTEFGEKQYELL